MSDKVYCCDCKYYVVRDSQTGSEVCNSPENMADTYYKPMSRRVHDPVYLNAYNHCQFFKKHADRI